MQTPSRAVQRWIDLTSALVALLYRLVEALTRALCGSRFLLHGIGKIRRFFLVHFCRDYVRRQLTIRSGSCRQCGTCCNLLFTCPMLTKGGRCFAYGKCRPEACKVFPINQQDIEEVRLCGHNCGYRFDTEDVPVIASKKS